MFRVLLEVRPTYMSRAHRIAVLSKQNFLTNTTTSIHNESGFKTMTLYCTDLMFYNRKIPLPRLNNETILSYELASYSTLR